MILLEKILFYLLIFCLPFQTRKILFQWGDGFNEWTSAYLYLTDLLILLIFLLWFWRKRKQRFFQGQSLSPLGTVPVWLIAFLIISLISLVNARNIQLGFYQWFKLLEMVGLFFYLRSYVILREPIRATEESRDLLRDSSPKPALERSEGAQDDKIRFNFNRLAQVFIASGLVQSLIAIGQYASQKSLGLKFLAERPLSAEIAGVAKIVVDGVKIIRPYGTFPHPNLLAAFLLISIFFLYYLWLSKKHSFSGFCFLSVINFGLVFILFLTFSRTIIAVFLLASLIYFIFVFWRVIQTPDKELFKRVISIILLFFVHCSLFIVFAWPEISSRFSISLTEQSVGLRSFYNQTAFFVIQEHPWLGLGMGNFVWEIRHMFDLLSSWVHQPVHNIYLLIASETGLIGLFLFLMFVFTTIKGFVKFQTINREQFCLLFIIFCSLFIGLFDHFFWTLQQGQLMFWLILGIIAGSQESNLTKVVRRV